MKTIEGSTFTEQSSHAEYSYLYERRYASYWDALAVAATVPDNDLSGAHRAKEKWTGSKSLADAVQIGQRGADFTPSLEAEGLAQQLREHVAPRVNWAYDVAGAEPDVGLYLSGEPEYMRYPVFERTPTFGVVCRIAVNVTNASGVTAATIRERGERLMAACNALVTAGYSVEVDAILASTPAPRSKSYGLYLLTVPILGAGEPPSFPHMAFALTHASFLRRIMLGLSELEDDRLRLTHGFRNDHQYGYPQDIPKDVCGRYDYVLPAGPIDVEALLTSWGVLHA